MYYVNREQIEERLAFVPYLNEAAGELLRLASDRRLTPMEALAQERVLHLAVEIVTDVGSLMIDGFIMRDASSYEDIVDILRGEEVFPAGLADELVALVLLRKPLVQQYMQLERGSLHPRMSGLPERMERFAEAIRAYLRAHL